MRYVKAGLRILGVLALVVMHGLLRVLVPKWSLEEYEFGGRSSMEKKENIQRHQKGTGK